jgi:hypothetical protein
MMNRIIAGDTAEFERAMVLGLSRSRDLADDPLTAVALLGSRLKCNWPPLPNARPASPETYTPDALYLSGQARMLSVKLLGEQEGQAADAIAMAVSRAISASGLRLHPFDYSRLEGFIASTAAQRTHAERAWLAKVRPERTPDDEPYADGPVSEETLPRLGKSAKLQFIRELRHRDAAHARQVMEYLWPNEPANTRADLLRLLQTGLTDDDRAFLESLSSDRAQSVRETASQLLARIAGTEAFADRMANLKRYIEVASKGLLRRTKVLKFKAADSGSARRDVAEEQRRLLQGLRLADVAAALGETSATLLGAAEASEEAGVLPLLLLQLAAAGSHLDLVEHHQKILDGLDPVTMLGFIEQVVMELDPQLLDRFLLVAIRPGPIWTSGIPEIGHRLYAALGRPLPATAAELVMQHCGKTEGQSDKSFSAFVDAIAPLIPASRSAAFVTEFEQQSRRAHLYHRLLPLLPPLQS